MTYVNRTECNRLLLSALCAVQCIVLLTASTNLFAASMNLAWNANRESDLAGYRIYYGTSSGNYTSFQETGRVTSYALSNLTEGRTYYIAMTAFDTARNESRRSSEIRGIAQDAELTQATVYEDSEDGETVGWTVYDKLPAGGRIENIYDGDRQSYVIELTGYGTNNGYRLGNTNGGDWHNESQTVIQWSVNYSESFIVYIDLETTAGHRYLTYKPVDFDLLGIGEYVFFGLGADATDGQWHTFVRDLQADLNRAQPGVVINEVNGFLIRGSGMVDDIKLISGSIMYEDGEDGLTIGWTVYDNLPAGARIDNVYDSERRNNVIELAGSGTNNGYRLVKAGGTKWYNTTQRVIEWSMSYTESFTVYIDMETTAGHRYLTYPPANTNQLGTGEYVFFGLGTNAIDGQWHTFVRDLQADLNLAQPGVIINEVNGFLIRGSGLVDDIKMID